MTRAVWSGILWGLERAGRLLVFTAILSALDWLLGPSPRAAVPLVQANLDQLAGSMAAPAVLVLMFYFIMRD